MYTCSNCGNASKLKLGRCTICNEFGTFVFIAEESQASKGKGKSISVSLKNQTAHQAYTLDLHHPEFSRIYGDGLRSSGVYLIAGEPGIGKSTIVLAMIHQLINHFPKIRVDYYSAEESVAQVTDRVNRTMGETDQLTVYYGNSIQEICASATQSKSHIIVLDSIQMMEDENTSSSSGSPAQVRSVSEYFTHWCKQHHRIGLIIGHVTKSGEIAGPKYLEHIVDVVSYLEGDRSGELRFLRNRKNRFGNAEETAIFRMTGQGLMPASLSDVNQSTSICLGEPGNVLSVALDTTRPMLVGVEVLCNRTKFSYPKRVGLSSNRLDMLIAIMEKHCRVDLSEVDIYVNVPGDTGISDTGLDLAVVVGIIGQVRNKSIPADNVFIGEVGLGGQIIATAHHSKRIKEISGNYHVIDHQTIKSIKQIFQYFE